MKNTTAGPAALKTTQERIYYLFQQTGQTQLEFASVLGIGQSHLSGVMSTKVPSHRLLVTIAEKTGANLEWLVSGEGQIYRGPDDPPELARVIQEARRMWDSLEDDVERFEMAATMLRTMAERNRKKRMALVEESPKVESPQSLATKEEPPQKAPIKKVEKKTVTPKKVTKSGKASASPKK